MKKYIVLLMVACAVLACKKESNSPTDTGGSTGTGGSLARFTIVGDHLYTVEQQNLKTYALSSNGSITLKSNIAIGWDIETIYPYNGKLFIGSMNAMYIYDLKNPTKPERLGVASHIRACDPVVAEGDVAYVTVRSGVSCGGQINALLVYDVKNLQKPVEKKSINLINPQGLGIQNQVLYVCDGYAGLRVFDVSSPLNPIEKMSVKEHNFIDCIPYGDLLICMLEDGWALYDISNPLSPNFLAKNPK